MKTRVCVFCSSSNTLDEIYYKDAEKLGKLIAENNMDLVYGGSNVGTMHTIAKSAKQNGATVYGVMPEKLYNFGVYSDECDDFFLTEGMRERKAKLDEISEATVAMPGGFGTLEEVSEMLVQKQLGYNNKPIVFLNTNNFYGKLIEFFEVIKQNNFAKNISKNSYYVADTPEEAIEYILNYKPEHKEIKAEDLYTNLMR